ncbi:hypothetical protein [Nocardia sp. NPDC024068]|uniref:hypothetical protein n=1 Tax=Nocardia sp. NPDC024068 TaxID=3157197 RepID=UPI0033EA2620
MLESTLLNPVVALRDAFEGLPDFVRLPIEMVVFGGMLPNTDISQMRWMAEELRTDAAALGEHAEGLKNILAQEHSIGRFGDGFRDALDRQQDGAGKLREQAVALADQADAAANEAEKHLCVMFVFAIDLAVRLVGMMMAASASGPAGVVAAAPPVQASLLAGRARVTAMRAAWKQAYERIAADTAARMPKVGPGRFAVVAAVQAAGLTAGVDAGVQGLQVAAGHRAPLLMGPDGTNPTGIDLRSIGLAGFAGVAGAAGGMLAARYAPTIFPAVGSSPMLAGLVHGTAGAVSGLGATALVAGWPEHYTEILGALVNGGFSGAVFARAGMPRTGVISQIVDGSGGFVHPGAGPAWGVGSSVAHGISQQARAEWAGAEAAWTSGDRTGATVPDSAVSAAGTSGAPAERSAAVTTSAAADSVPGDEPGPAERTESAGRSDPSAVDRPESASAAARPAESVPGVGERAEPVSAAARAEPGAAPGSSGYEAVADPMWASPDVRGTEPGMVAAHPDPAVVAAVPEPVAGRVESSGAAAGADAAGAGGRPETTGAPGRPATAMPAGRVDTPVLDGAQRNPVGGRMPGEAPRTVSAAGETAPPPRATDTAANRPHASTAAASAKPASAGPATGAGAAGDRPVPRGADGGAEAGRNGMGTDAGRVRSSGDGHTTSAQADTGGAGSEPATAGGENTSGERVGRATDSGETNGEPGISGDRAVLSESDASGDRVPAGDAESAGAAGDRVPEGPTSRERAEEILADFHARSAEHLPANLRLSNLSDEAVAAGLFHGRERDSLIAGMEIIRRRTVSEQIPGGMVVRHTQLEGALELAAGRPVEMLPGQGKTLMFMLHSMRQAVSEGSVLLVTTADGLAHREFTEYRRVLEPFGIDVLRADQESGFGHKPGRPAIVVATGETVGHLCNSGQEAPPRSVVIDEMDAVVDRGEKTFIRSENQSEAAAQPTAREVFDAHDFLADALAKGQLSHDDFGLKRLAEEIDIELPDGTFEIGADYWYDGQASLTPGGVEKVQALPGGQRWLQDMGRSRLEMAAAAEFTSRNKTHYVMDQGKIVIIDQGEHGLQRNPKTSSETRWSAEEGKAGLAQAVEAKEIRAAEAIGMSAEQHGIVLRADTDSATSITAAEIYGTDRFFDHVTGASGTLADLGGVLKTVYNLDAPHRVDPYNPVRLVEGAPEVHENTRAKLHALAESAHAMWDGGHGRFQEILCHRNDLVEKQVNALVRAGVPREVIEAVDATRIAKWGADWEARLQNVFDAAGAQGKILVINRQGQRGVDISPSDEVLAQGGMHVWMTEVPEQSYIYEQGKNRTARNGAPGSAQAFMSPQDGIIRNAVHLSGVRETAVSYEQAVGAHRADPTPETHHAVVESADALASLVPGLQERAHHQQTAQFLLRYAPLSEPEALLEAVTPWHPDNADLAGPDTTAHRVSRLAGLLGVTPSALAAAAASMPEAESLPGDDAISGGDDSYTKGMHTDTGDPLRELLRRAAVPPAAVEALQQSIDATAPGRAVRYALLTDEQALDHLTSRRAQLAGALGWAAAEVEGAEGLRQVGDAATAAQRQLARALTAAADPGPASERGPGPSSDLSPTLAEVSATVARDILGEALRGEVSGGAANRQYGPESARADRTVPNADVVDAAAHYFAITALLDLVTEIHRRSPNNCVDNGVTGMRVLFPDKAGHFTMPPGGLALRGRDWATTRQSFRNGAPQESRSLDDAVAPLKQRPGGAQVLVYRWKNSEGRSTDADNHLVVLVNDSTDPARPNLKVVDLAASPDGDYTNDFGPEHLADRRALLNRAVPFATWQREQERYLGRLPAAGRRFWTIDFDAAGELVPAGDPGTAAMTERPEVSPEQERAVEEASAPVTGARTPQQPDRPPGSRINASNSARGAEPARVGARPSENAAPAEPAATARRSQSADAEIEAGADAGGPNWRVRRLRDEIELARYLYHKEETKQAARAMIVRMREVLTALHPDATADQIERAFLAPERVMDGMVPRSVSLDELLADGNLRQLMQALYNPLVRRGDLVPEFEGTEYAVPMLYAGLARLMNDRGKQQSWEERARELGLDDIALREVRDRITGGDPQRDIGEAELKDIVNQAHDAPDLDDIVAERTWSSAEEREFGLRHRVRLGITVQDWALLGMPLSRWEIQAIPGDLVALRKSRLDPRRELRRDEHGLVREDILEDRLRFEDQLRGGSGIADTAGSVRFVIPVYAYDGNGRRMRDESGNAVVTDVFVYRDAGLVDAETALALDPGEFAVPLPWGTGSSTVTFDKEGRLFRELAVERGIPLLAGISGSAARLASAFRWLRPAGVDPVDFAGAILAKLSPIHHSMYEQLRGMQLTGLRLPLVDEAVSRARRHGAVDEMFAALSEQFDHPLLHHASGIASFTRPDDGDTPRAMTGRDETGPAGAIGSTLHEPGGGDAGSPGWIGSRPSDSGARPEESSSGESRGLELVGPVDARSGLPAYVEPDDDLYRRAKEILADHWGSGTDPGDLVPLRQVNRRAGRSARVAGATASLATRNALYVHSLSGDELRTLVRAWPEFVGKAGGFPRQVRDQANRWALARAIARFEDAESADRLSRRDRALRDHVFNARDLLIRARNRVVTLNTPGVPAPTVLLEWFDAEDPGAGSAIVSIGSADPVAEAWHVDGSAGNLRRLDQRVQLAANHYEVAARANPDRPVRVVVWSGTDGHRLAADMAALATVPAPAPVVGTQLVVHGGGGRAAKKALSYEAITRTVDSVVVCGESNITALGDRTADLESHTKLYFGAASQPGSPAEPVPGAGTQLSCRFPLSNFGQANSLVRSARIRMLPDFKLLFEFGKPLVDEFLSYIDERVHAPTEALGNLGAILADRPDLLALYSPSARPVGFAHYLRRGADSRAESPYDDILPRDPGTGRPNSEATEADRVLAAAAIAKYEGRPADPTVLLHRGLADDVTRAAELARRNRDWWQNLTSEHQRAMVAAHPEVMGNAPGIPSGVATYANDHLRRRTWSDIRTDVVAEGVGKGFGIRLGTSDRSAVFRNLYAVEEALTRAVTVHRDIPQPIVSTTALDPAAFGGNGSGVFVIGNTTPEDADHVIWYVDGVNTRLQSLLLRLEQARNLYEEMLRTDPSATIAVVCWLGYEAPANLKEHRAATPALAAVGGQAFARDVLALRALSAAKMSMIGYSYGSVVVSEATVGGRLDGVFEHGVVLGSPGRGWRYDPTADRSCRNRWVIAQSGDPIPALGAASPDLHGRRAGGLPLGLGVDPATDPTAVRLRGERCFPDTLMSPDYGHIQYLGYALPAAAQPNESLRNLALVLTGRGDEALREQRRPLVDDPPWTHNLHAPLIDPAADRRAPQLDPPPALIGRRPSRRTRATDTASEPSGRTPTPWSRSAGPGTSSAGSAPEGGARAAPSSHPSDTGQRGPVTVNGLIGSRPPSEPATGQEESGGRAATPRTSGQSGPDAPRNPEPPLVNPATYLSADAPRPDISPAEREVLGEPGRSHVGVEAENFPLPGRLDRKTRPHTAEAAAELDRLAEFAQDQADWANTVVADLRGLGHPPGPADWEQEFWKITDQRTTTTASEAGLDALSEAIDRPRRTRLGEIPRYGEGPIWIPGRQMPVGLPTWAQETFAAAGARVPRRFTAEGVSGDILETRIRLTDGTTALGRRLIRGETAENLAQEIRQRRAERTGKLPFAGPALAPGQVFSETSPQEERTRILNDAFAQLAAPGEFTTATWAEIAYKLFHAPQRKSGSDAVIRSFMAAAGIHHLGRVPDFPHDIDLVAMVTSQDEFIALIVEHGNSAGGLGSHPSTEPVGDAPAPGGAIGRRPSDDAAGAADAGPGWAAVESLRRDVFAGHTTIADIGDALQAELRALPGGEDHSVLGFDRADADVDIGELRVYAQAMLDICTVFPGHTKRSIVLDRHDLPRHIRTYDSSYPAERQRQIVLDLRTGRLRGEPKRFPMAIFPVRERPGDSAERATYGWTVRDLLPHCGIPGWEYAHQLVLPTLMESFEQDFADTARPVERQRGPHREAFDDWRVLQGLGRSDLARALGREYTVAVGVAAAFAGGRAVAGSPAGRLYESVAAQDGIEKHPIAGDAPIGELREATNAEKLGVPADLVDEFSVIGADADLGDPDVVARVNAAVGDTLQVLLRGVPGHENIKVFGFDSPHLDTDVVKEVARGMVWLMRTYPDTDIREVGFGDLSHEDDYAKAGTLPAHGAVRCYTKSIVFDTTWAGSAGEVRKQARRAVDTGLHPESFLLRPVIAYTAHEYMHALGVAGSNDGEVAALEALADLYLAEERGEATPAGWPAWLRTVIPAYGFDEAGRFIAEESVADGGADVAVRRYVLGPQAEVGAPSLVQHDLLVEAAARNAQHGRWESVLDAHRFRSNESLLRRHRRADTMIDVAGPAFDAARARVLGAADTSDYAHSDRPERPQPSDAGEGDGSRSEESRGNMGDGLIGRRPSAVPPAQRYGPGISDEWSELIEAGTSRLGRNRAIGARLQSVLRALPGHDDVVVKFDDSRLTPEVLAEFARAWVTLFTGFPDVDVPVIEPSVLWESEAVSAFASDDPRRTRVAGSSAEQEPPQVLALYVNRRFFLKPDVFQSESGGTGTPDDPYDDYFLDHVNRAVAAGELPEMVQVRPAYAVAVLAFAVALNISRGRRAHPAVDELLREAFAGTGRPQHGPEFRRWQLEMLPDAVEWSTGVLDKSKALALGLLSTELPVSTELPDQEKALLTGLAGLLDAHDGSASRGVAASDTGPVPLPEPGNAALMPAMVIDDEWAALSTGHDIATHLRNVLYAETGRHFEVAGFDSEPDLDVLREYARTAFEFRDDLVAYNVPEIAIIDTKKAGGTRSLGYAELAYDEEATPRRYEYERPGETAVRLIHARRLVLDRNYARNAENFWRAKTIAADIGYHPDSGRHRPVRALVLHELGHAADFAGHGVARTLIAHALPGHYIAERLGPATEAGYQEWLHNQLCGYSFHADGQLNPAEAIAEAFSDVRSRGYDNVGDATRIIYDLTVNAADNSPAGRVRRFLDRWRFGAARYHRGAGGTITRRTSRSSEQDFADTARPVERQRGPHREAFDDWRVLQGLGRSDFPRALGREYTVAAGVAAAFAGGRAVAGSPAAEGVSPPGESSDERIGARPSPWHPYSETPPSQRRSSDEPGNEFPGGEQYRTRRARAVAQACAESGVDTPQGRAAVARAYDVTYRSIAPFIVKHGIAIAQDCARDVQRSGGRGPTVVYLARDGYALAETAAVWDPEFFGGHCTILPISRHMMAAVVHDADELSDDERRIFAERLKFRSQVHDADLSGAKERFLEMALAYGVPLTVPGSEIVLVDTGLKGTTQDALSALFPEVTFRGRYVAFMPHPDSANTGSMQGYAMHLSEEESNGGRDFPDLPGDPGLTFGHVEAHKIIEYLLSGTRSSAREFRFIDIAGRPAVRAKQDRESPPVDELNPLRIVGEYADDAVRLAVGDANFYAVHDLARRVAGMRDHGADWETAIDRQTEFALGQMRSWISRTSTDETFNELLDSFVPRADRHEVRALRRAIDERGIDEDQARAIWEDYDQLSTQAARTAFAEQFGVTDGVTAEPEPEFPGPDPGSDGIGSRPSDVLRAEPRVEPGNFPLPGRFDRYTRPHTAGFAAELDRFGGFSQYLADWANAMLADLRGLAHPPTPTDWKYAFRKIAEQRTTAPASKAGTAALSQPITRPGRDIFGTLPHFGDGPVQDPVTQKWLRLPTWAQETYAAAGAYAQRRFIAEGVTGDVLETTVHLADGTTALGRSLARGATAEAFETEFRQFLGEQHGTTTRNRPPLGADNVLSITTSPEESSRILDDAFNQLAASGEFTTAIWADIAYKLYHAPQRASGSDAVTRAFMAAVAVHRLGRVPTFPHDIDLLAMTTRQDEFITLIVEHDHTTGRPISPESHARGAGAECGAADADSTTPWSSPPGGTAPSGGGAGTNHKPRGSTGNERIGRRPSSESGADDKKSGRWRATPWKSERTGPGTPDPIPTNIGYSDDSTGVVRAEIPVEGPDRKADDLAGTGSIEDLPARADEVEWAAERALSADPLTLTDPDGGPLWGIRDENHVAQLLYHRPSSIEAARAMLDRLREVLAVLHFGKSFDQLDGAQRQAIDNAFYAPEKALQGGMVLRSVPLDELRTKGNLREVMAAVLNAIVRSRQIPNSSGTTLDEGLAKLLNRRDWAESAGRLGLDVDALNWLRERIIGGDEQVVITARDIGADRNAVSEPRYIAIADELTRSYEDRRVREASDQKRWSIVAQHRYLHGRPLSLREYEAIAPGGLVAFRFTELLFTRIRPEEIPRDDRGLVDVETLASQLRAEDPTLRYIVPAYSFSATGLHVRDELMNAQVYELLAYYEEGVVDATTAARLDRGKYFVSPSWVPGMARVGFDKSGEWAQEMSEQGKVARAGISGTTARMAARFRWIRPPGVAEMDFAAAILAFILPVHHSLEEAVRGMEMAGLPVVDIAPGSGPAELYRAIAARFGIPTRDPLRSIGWKPLRSVVDPMSRRRLPESVFGLIGYADRPGVDEIVLDKGWSDAMGLRVGDRWAPVPFDGMRRRYESMLEQVLPGRDVELFGFSGRADQASGAPPPDVLVLRELARGLADGFAESPDARVDVRRIGFADLGQYRIARTETGSDLQGRLYVESITFNSRFAADAQRMALYIGREIDAGYFPEVFRARPIYAVAANQVGHALDAAGNHSARQQISAMMLKHYRQLLRKEKQWWEHLPPAEQAEWGQWWKRLLPRVNSDPRGPAGEAGAYPGWLADTFPGYVVSPAGVLLPGEKVAGDYAVMQVAKRARADTYVPVHISAETRLGHDLLLRQIRRPSAANWFAELIEAVERVRPGGPPL